MKTSSTLSSLACVLLFAALINMPALAERADRGKPLEVVADTQGSIDMIKQLVIFTGNVVISKGSLTIKADRVEVREGPNGYRTAIAVGGNRSATFSQKRDGVNEFIEGQAERLEYEERGDVVRFIKSATVRRLQGKSVAEEITGDLITYDSTNELFTVSGGGGARESSSGTPSNGGRVRAVLTPRVGSEAAAAARDAATTSDSGAKR